MSAETGSETPSKTRDFFQLRGTGVLPVAKLGQDVRFTGINKIPPKKRYISIASPNLYPTNYISVISAILR
jgi:hypothetical protein